ncbi:MAG: ankyrin repeat domain-containing protein [Candidatus Endonucleobacter bathymodioli]|uniref:Ankyrin repeat domain-containing protein n=1 Tax=Candidatus Endonucleibacter bathymodioli TaxID=539814 RepID=A0AA90NUC4_9GAMM|nr:ankyrin repeat domain-containing protein [Candidatus Endonucleobacter bathymodioli]
MFLSLHKSLSRKHHLIDLLLLFSIIAGVYSGYCCAVWGVSQNSYERAPLIDSVYGHRSNTYKYGSFLGMVQKMDDCALLNSMKYLLDIAIKNNDDNLINILKFSKAPHHLSTGNDDTDQECADLNHAYVVKFLRDNIVSLTGTYESGENLLSAAIPFDNKKLIELLVKSEINVNSHDNNQNTPLHKAVRCNNLDIVKILLAAGAKVDCVGNHIQSNESETIRKGFGASPSSDHRTPLHTAVSNAKIDIVKVLIERGANPNFYIKGQYSLLRIAVIANSHSILKELLMADAKMDAKDSADCSLFHYAIFMSRCPNIIKELIVNVDQYQINKESRYGITALHTAILNGSHETIKILLDNGANPNSSNGLGDRPLHSALHRNAFTQTNGIIAGTLKLLIAAGADVNCHNELGMTPLMLMVQHTFYFGQAADTITSIINMMLRNGADIDMADQKGYTALHHATHNSNASIVSLLLKNGANRDIKNKSGATAEKCATPAMSKIISEAAYTPRAPTSMITIVRHSLLNFIIKQRQDNWTPPLSDIINELPIPDILHDFLKNPI